MIHKITQSIILLFVIHQLSCDGGKCEYDDYPGTCIYNAEGFFTFTGTINDEEVVYTDNGWDEDPNVLPEGESVECTLSFITKGTCTPCMFDIGGCGVEATDAFAEQN